MKQKVLILCSNYEESRFPKSPDAGNRFFTYGFGGHFGRLFSNNIDSYEIEVWRLDNHVDNKYYEKRIDGILYRVYKSTGIKKIGLFSWAFIKELKREFKNSSPVLFVVHTHNFQTYQIAYFLRKAMIITTHHGDWSPFFVYRNSKGLRKLRALLGIAVEKLTMNNIDHFLLCDYKQIPYIKKAAKGAEWTLFSTGLDVDKFRLISKETARKELGLDLSGKYILYVGKLYKYKQIEDLLKIWDEIRQQRPEVELLLAGNEPRGSWGEEYYDMAASYGARIIGRVLNEDLYRYYCASDVYVLIALREDYFGGTGIAPLESLACNTPVVSSSMVNYLGDNAREVCEIPETLEGYKDAILKVINNPKNYKGLRESMKKYYDYNVMAERADDIIKKVLEKYNSQLPQSTLKNR